MTRRWWGGPGISVALHAALFVGLLYVAAQSSQMTVTAPSAFTRVKFIHTATPGPEGAGSGRPDAGRPRPAQMRERTPVAIVPPRSITNVEPPPAAAVPAIAANAVDTLPGAPMAIDADTVGAGSGGGPGGGRGPGVGPGEGPGAGDVPMAGVGGVSDPVLIYEVKPNYTVDAMRAKIQGVVIMEVDVLANGTVDPRRIRITRSLEPGLDREATIAVRQWKFRASTLRGRQVTARVLVEIAFTLR